MKLADTFAPWLQQPVSAPVHMDGRELDSDKDSNATFIPEPAPSDPQTQRQLDAALWLEDHLPQPRRVAEVIAEWTGGEQRLQRNGSLRWEGGKDGTDGHWIEDICWARRLVDVESFEGPDERFWWRKEVNGAN